MSKLADKIVNEDRADAILLGCMTMSFSGLDKKIEKKTGIPVLNAGRTSLKFAESLLSMDLSHSKLTYPFPPKLAKTQKEKKKRA